MGIAARLVWADRFGEVAGRRLDAGHHRVLAARIERAFDVARAEGQR